MCWRGGQGRREGESVAVVEEKRERAIGRVAREPEREGLDIEVYGRRVPGSCD